MITENLSTLKIHKLTKAQYERELAAGRIDPNALYLTPDEEIDLSIYATVEQLNGKADAKHTHTITDVTNLRNELDVKANKATTLEGYGITDGATKTYVDTLIEGLTTEGTADAALVQAALTAHKDDKNNPHGVTLSQLGVTATSDELNYMDGVTSNVQTQLDNKAESGHIHADLVTTTYVNTELGKKADSDHAHDDLYYTETEINEKFNPINTHIANGNIHVTSDEKAAWNNKMNKTSPTGTGSFSLNRKANSTVGDYSIAIGADTIASGVCSYAEGSNTTASGDCAHAEGIMSTASGAYAHAEGFNTMASTSCSHAEGDATEVSGDCAHAEGYYTIAAGEKQHVQGKHNIADTDSVYAHIVGNGTHNKRSNAHTVDWDGNAWFAGDVYVGGTNQDDAEKLAKISDITNHIPEISWNDLADKPNILDDGTKDFNITDESGNVILKVDTDGLRTTQVIADTVVVGGYDIQSQLDDKIGFSDVVPIANGGTGSDDGAAGLANLFAAGETVLSSYQYGDTLSSTASEGTVFFKKATGTVADMDTNLVSELMLKMYPVGSIYTSVNSTSPADLFGGTWEQLKDRFLLGAGDSYSNGATGGQSTITLQESDLPSAAIVFDDTAKTTGWSCGAWSNTHGKTADWYAMPKSQTTNPTYTNPTNMPPYLVVYMWKRVA